MIELDQIVEDINDNLVHSYIENIYEHFSLNFYHAGKYEEVYAIDSIALLRNSKEFDKIFSFLEKYIMFDYYFSLESNHQLYKNNNIRLEYNNYIKRKLINFCNKKENLLLILRKKGHFYVNGEVLDDFKDYLISIKKEINKDIFDNAMKTLTVKRNEYKINFAATIFSTKLKITSVF
jgi:hypothetical protein